MADKKDYKWNISEEAIKVPYCAKFERDYNAAESQMRQRTKNHELYGIIAKNKSIHDYLSGNKDSQQFSEGSTQYIQRKTLADTIQRVPDGELQTQYDKASVERIWLDYIFNNKVLWSEYEGIDMLSNLTNTYKMAFTYCFAPVRTGFEKDYDNDVRISYNLEQWSDIYINPDCTDIRRPQWVIHRQYMTRADVEQLIDEEGNVRDQTYNEDTIKYILDHDFFSAKRWESEKMSDILKGSTAIASLELLTKYERGKDEFVTFVPGLQAEFRRTPNYDPRKGIPWDIFVLEPDPDFPCGISQVEFLLADQQFNDLFQTSAYKNLLLAMEPPIMVAGWETTPSAYAYEPRAIWDLGNNPNQAKVDQVKIDNAVLTGWSNTRESISASMLRNLNVMETAVAEDGISGFSGTAPGVEAQQKNKNISINQYQKRVEIFFAEWCNHALRMYINAMSGEQWMTVDEETRRKLFDIDRKDLIDGNKVKVDFGMLSTDLLEFKMRAGSLMQRKEEAEREAVLECLQPVLQNLQGWSEQNRPVFENEVVLPLFQRFFELSDIDIGQTISNSLATHQAELEIQKMQAEIDMQQQQIAEQQMQMDAMQQALPPESQEQIAQQIPNAPLPEEPPMVPQEDIGQEVPPQLPDIPIGSPDEQVIPDELLLNI